MVHIVTSGLERVHSLYATQHPLNQLGIEFHFCKLKSKQPLMFWDLYFNSFFVLTGSDSTLLGLCLAKRRHTVSLGLPRPIIIEARQLILCSERLCSAVNTRENKWVFRRRKRLLLLSFKNRLSDILFSLFASYYSFALLRSNARLYQSPASPLLLAGFIANPEIQAGARPAGT